MPDLSVSRLRPVRLWLLAAAAMIFLTLVVGGATRLTESGLSITEWKPVTGIMPPLSQAAWQAEFDGYKQIPQYRELNKGMSLERFKTIYWWEWTHRLLARTVGMVFLLPFLFFLWRGMIPGPLKWRLWGIFAGGAALGAVGWWMVSSGLAGTDRVSVSQYRLAFHLTLACAIFAAILWTAQQLRREAPRDVPPRLRLTAAAIMLLVLLQIYLGALVAGSGAGLAYNTWPLIDGSFIPAAASLLHMTPAWRNAFENILTIQFDHRMLAYTIFVVAVLHAIDALRSERRAAAGALTVAALVTAQAALGIVTLLYQVALPLALTHQMVAIVVFTAAIVHAEHVSHRESVAAPRAVTVEQGA